MAKYSKARPFRINPVELAIFTVVTLIFVNSVYNLFYDNQGFNAAALTPIAARTNATPESRAPASANSSFLKLDLKCEPSSQQETGASKILLAGPLCEMNPAGEANQLNKTSVVNVSNKFNATVFTDVSAGKFSTDYIPLNVGKNEIHLEFTYDSGKVVTQDVTVIKN